MPSPPKSLKCEKKSSISKQYSSPTKTAPYHNKLKVCRTICTTSRATTTVTGILIIWRCKTVSRSWLVLVDTPNLCFTGAKIWQFRRSTMGPNIKGRRVCGADVNNDLTIGMYTDYHGRVKHTGADRLECSSSFSASGITNAATIIIITTTTRRAGKLQAECTPRCTAIYIVYQFP